MTSISSELLDPPLTPKEIEVLSYILDHPGCIWDYYAFDDETNRAFHGLKERNIVWRNHMNKAIIKKRLIEDIKALIDKETK